MPSVCSTCTMAIDPGANNIVKCALCIKFFHMRCQLITDELDLIRSLEKNLPIKVFCSDCFLIIAVTTGSLVLKNDDKLAIENQKLKLSVERLKNEIGNIKANDSSIHTNTEINDNDSQHGEENRSISINHC